MLWKDSNKPFKDATPDLAKKFKGEQLKRNICYVADKANCVAPGWNTPGTPMAAVALEVGVVWKFWRFYLANKDAKLPEGRFTSATELSKSLRAQVLHKMKDAPGGAGGLAEEEDDDANWPIESGPNKRAASNIFVKEWEAEIPDAVRRSPEGLHVLYKSTCTSATLTGCLEKLPLYTTMGYCHCERTIRKLIHTAQKKHEESLKKQVAAYANEEEEESEEPEEYNETLECVKAVRKTLWDRLPDEYQIFSKGKGDPDFTKDQMVIAAKNVPVDIYIYIYKMFFLTVALALRLLSLVKRFLPRRVESKRGVYVPTRFRYPSFSFHTAWMATRY